MLSDRLERVRGHGHDFTALRDALNVLRPCAYSGCVRSSGRGTSLIAHGLVAQAPPARSESSGRIKTSPGKGEDVLQTTSKTGKDRPTPIGSPGRFYTV
jgi:hypothetical protein